MNVASKGGTTWDSPFLMARTDTSQAFGGIWATADPAGDFVTLLKASGKVMLHFFDGSKSSVQELPGANELIFLDLAASGSEIYPVYHNPSDKSLGMILPEGYRALYK